MDPQNQQFQNNTPEPQIQPPPPLEPVQAKSRLSLVGLLLVFVFPIAGLVISIIALYQIKKNHLRGSVQAIFGIVLGVIFTIPLLFVFWLFIAFGGFKGNDAQKAAQPFIVQIQKAGGKKLCENGDGGHGLDNTQPWYDVYYEIPDSPNLTSMIKTEAAKFGYPLKANNDLIKQLKDESFGEETFNKKANYLISEKNGKRLSVTINRNTSVPLRCGVSDYGKKQPTGAGKAILEIDFGLPDTNQ